MAEKKSMKAVELTYTDKEMAAIEILNANRGQKLTCKQLGVASAVLTSLVNKATDERPFAAGIERVIVHKEPFDAVCEHCGSKLHGVYYWVD